jgi:hypothetical protein
VSWEGPDKERDEDRYYEDESMVPAALLSLDSPFGGSSEVEAARMPSAPPGSIPADPPKVACTCVSCCLRLT